MKSLYPKNEDHRFKGKEKQLTKNEIEKLQLRLQASEIFLVRLSDIEDDAHCIPTHDTIQHVPSLLCECVPKIVSESALQGDNSTVMHRMVREQPQ